MAKQTRSYFAPALSLARPAMFTRLAQFHTPDCGVQFFMRFRVFHAPGRHPILAFSNAKSKTFFWDFERFGEYRGYVAEVKEAQAAGRSVVAAAAAAAAAGAGDAAAPPAVVKPSWLVVKRGSKKTAAAAVAEKAVWDGAASLRSFADKESMVSASPDPEGGGAAAALGHSKETMAAWAEMYDLSNPVGYVKAHRTLQIDGGFVGRQVGWSPEGEWCVVVGNGNRALIYQRWGKEKGVAQAA